MHEEFDPYHKWLGIPPEEQPANHYRLLAIKLFEADLDVIESAADQRMSHLRTYQAGKYSTLSQKLLNEVASAKVCLLNAQKKVAYDEALRARMPAKPVEAASPAASSPATPSYSLDNLGLGESPAPSGSGIRSGSAVQRRPAKAIKQAVKQRQANEMAVRVLLTLGAVAVLAVGGLYFAMKGTNQVEERPASVAAGAATPGGTAPTVAPHAQPLSPLGLSYSPAGELAFVDFARKANGRLTFPFPGSEQGDDLASLPQGDHVFCGVKFRIANPILQLASVRSPGTPRIDGIEVNQRFSKLYLLQGLLLAKPIELGTPVGTYRVHYDDGSEVTIPIEYGKDVREWHGSGAVSLDRGRLAWEGDNRVVSRNGSKIRLFALSWDNPRRDQAVTAIDFCAAGTSAAPFCVAMTMELERGASSTPVKRGLGPSLLEPVAGANLPNRESENDAPASWQFRWSSVAGAKRYQLLVRAPSRDEPVVDTEELTTPSYTYELKARVGNEDSTAWRWRVRAFVGSAWTQWSEDRTFNIGAPTAAAPATAESSAEDAASTTAGDQQKHKIPDRAARDKALKLIEEVYAEEVRDSKTPQEKQVLARKILDQVDGTQEDAARWGLLRYSRELAIAAGDAETALQALERRDASFDVDPAKQQQQQVDVIVEALKVKVLPEQRRLNIAAAMGIVDKFTTQDDFSGAIAFATQVRDKARIASDPVTATQFDIRLRDLERRQQQYAEVAHAREVLKDRPDDPEANLVVGKHLCVNKNDWEKGLPLLAKGSDEALKDLAKQDMANPSEAVARLPLADAWYALGKADSQKANRAFLLRAQYWYDLSVSNLSGLERTKAEKRLEELKQLEEPHAKKQPAKPVVSKKTVVKNDVVAATRSGTIFASSALGYELYINGTQVMAGTSAVESAPYEFKTGDVITVRARGLSTAPLARGFACVIRVEPPQVGSKRKKVPFSIASGAGSPWQCYLPKDATEWFKPDNIGRKAPVALLDTPRQRGVTLMSSVPCMSMWGALTDQYVYFTMTVSLPR